MVLSAPIMDTQQTGRVPQIRVNKSPPSPGTLDPHAQEAKSGNSPPTSRQGEPEVGTKQPGTKDTPADLSFDDLKTLQTPSGILGLTPTHTTGKPSSSSEESLNTPTNLNTPSVNLSASQPQAFHFPDSDSPYVTGTCLIRLIGSGGD